jgi:hypothetical protein
MGYSMDNERVKIIYIASNGRSGSTILDLLLGAHPSCWTLGEFHVLPWELRTHTKPCGCGMPVEQCPFWSPIVSELQDVLLHGSIDRFRHSYLGSRTLLFDEIRFLASRSPWYRHKRQEHLDRYGRDNGLVLQRVLERARGIKGNQVSWLVDSSKSVYRLLWLKETGQFDVRVLHLVKDPRAFVYSMCKDQPAMPRPLQQAKAALRWNVENFLFDRLFRAHFREDEVLRVRYDDLAGAPQACLGRMTAWLGIPSQEGLVGEFRNENHAISGNPARFENAGIRLDEKWRRELGRGTQWLVRAATFQLAGRYGFPW